MAPRLAPWIVLAVIASTGGACRSEAPAPGEATARLPSDARPRPIDSYVGVRHRMVDETLAARGIRDLAVLAAMRTVQRHRMVPPEVRDDAYADRALPIGFGLTISQPYIVAVMTEAIGIERGDRVLEIGTGSGYQAAVLAELGAAVYTIEIHDELAARTRRVLARLGYDRIQLKVGDGYDGWPDAAPFDAIVVTAATAKVPAPLFDQLRPGGRIVIPLGDDYLQQLVVVVKRMDGTVEQRELFGVRFGPMIGKAATAAAHDDDDFDDFDDVDP